MHCCPASKCVLHLPPWPLARDGVLLLATGAVDQTVKLWDVQARTLLATLEGHADVKGPLFFFFFPCL